MHLATLMHSRLCHLLYNHVICIVGVSRGVRFVKGGRDFVKGGSRPPSLPLNEALVPMIPTIWYPTYARAPHHYTSQILTHEIYTCTYASLVIT